MPGERTHYEILGLPRTAALADIKKRYRELARELHPDVNQGKPDIAKRFAEVTSAYKTLSVADERATYDADLALREQRAARAAARTAANTFPGATHGSAARGARPGGANASRPSGGGPPPPRAKAASSGADTARLLAEAQAAFVRGKFVEARALCEQVIRRDRENGAAYEILGDVYRIQGKTDDAIAMYTMALQFSPRNHAVMERLERLARTNNNASGGATAQRVFFDNRVRGSSSGGTAQRAATPRSDNGGTFARDKRPLGTLLGGVVGYGLAFMSIGYLAVADQKPINNTPILFGPIATWSPTLLIVMALAGALLGFTMAATAAVRPIGDELILAGGGRGGRGGPNVPLGLILIVLSFVSFYAAALLYTVIGALQESLTPSLLRVFGVVVAAVLLLTAVYEPGRGQVLLFGGNVVFLALLFGWFLGDFFRPDGF